MLPPLISVMIAFFTLKNSESLLVKSLPWFQFTSFAVMHIMAALTQVK